MNINGVQNLNSGYLSLEATRIGTISDPRQQLYAQSSTKVSNPAATVNFSPESQARQSQAGDNQESESSLSNSSRTTKESEKLNNSTAKSNNRKNDTEKTSPDDLTEEERRQVNDLKKRDAEVKAHEQAHIAAGGAYVSGGASYEYEQGPDHQSYAVGGEVSIDTSAENTPEATIRKMQVVKRAALAPQKPSGQDRSVAAQAAQAEARARIELRQQRTEEAAEKREKSAENSGIDPLDNNRTEENSANPSNNRQTPNQPAGNQLNRTARTAYQSAATPFTPFNNEQSTPSYNTFA